MRSVYTPNKTNYGVSRRQKYLRVHNRYYPTFAEFREACLAFFEEKNLKKYRQ